MLLGYNTNGLAHHNLLEAIDLVAELGYRAVGITLDHGAISPYDANWHNQVRDVRSALERNALRSAIETGCRFLLDPRVKHEPTLVTASDFGRAQRLAFYQHAVRVASELGSDCVSIWSGVLRDDCDRETAWTRLIDGVKKLVDFADKHNVTIAFEPEPGMFIDRQSGFDELLDRLGPSPLKLTLDIGHLQCQGELPLGDMIRRYGSQLANVHLEDMRRGEHEHLPFGDGEIDFANVLRALRDANYPNGVYVELSRHSHDGPNQAKRSLDFLRSRGW